MSRKRTLPLTALAVAIAGFLAIAPSAAAGHTKPPPAPIPGGLQIPGGPFIHFFLPGPPSLTLPFSGLMPMGLDVEPSTITNFRGFTALAYLVGTARDDDGNEFNLEADIRVYRGRYVASDGSRHRGLFAFI